MMENREKRKLPALRPLPTPDAPATLHQAILLFSVDAEMGILQFNSDLTLFA